MQSFRAFAADDCHVREKYSTSGDSPVRPIIGAGSICDEPNMFCISVIGRPALVIGCRSVYIIYIFVLLRSAVWK